MTTSAVHAEQAYRYYRERKIRQACAEFELSLACGEDPEHAALERWLTFMLAGEFELAWQENDRVLRSRRETGATCSHLPEHERWLWDGTPLKGRRVLIRCFHGLGDTIQFIRFLPHLREVCREVSILPQPELQELIPLVMEAGAIEVELELMEVPYALRIGLDQIPATVPYLTVPGQRPRERGALRVGLVWASGGWKPERSVPLELFQFFDQGQDVELVGLQRGPATRFLPPRSPEFGEADWGNSSVMETARIIRGLDLVISTDTMVAHLAGALSVPVWTLLPWDADWRWMADGERSPWYPTMRLFRQQTPGEWADVVDRVRKKLTSYQKEIRKDKTNAGGERQGAQAPQHD